MRRLKLFLDAKAANTPPRGISKASRVIFSVLTLLFLSIGQVWGADATVTLPFEWTVSDGRDNLPTGVSHNGLGTDYAASNAPYRLKFDTQNDNILIALDASAEKVYFNIKKLGGAAESKFKVQGCATSNGTYSDIQEFTISGNQNAIVNCTTNVAINSSYRYIKIIKTVHPASGGNVGLGYVKITKTAVNRTVTWMCNGSPWSSGVVAGNTTVASGSKISAVPTAPTSSNCDNSKVFVGWTANEDYSNASTAPSDLFTDVAGSPTISADVTFYAVFATSTIENVTIPASSKQYSAIINYSQLTTGSYASNDGDHSSTATASDESTTTMGWTSSNVQQQSSKLHFKSNSGYIYNKESLGTINSITLSDNSGNFNVYTGTSAGPSTTTTGGYFKVKAQTVSGGPLVTSITVVFTKTIPASSQDVTVYSNYVTSCCTKHNITIASGIEHGTVEASPTSACEGATVNVTFTPTGDYHLKSWSVNGTPQDVNDNTFTMPDEAVTISAEFEANTVPVAINITANANATITTTPATSALPGATVTLACTDITSGYQFVSWNVTAGGQPVSVNNNQFTMPSAVVTVAANVLPTVTVRFMRNDVLYDTQSTYSGGTVSFPSAPSHYDANYPVFVGWADEISGVATDQPTFKSESTPITADIVYHAVFANTPVASGNYAKITTIEELTDGKYVIVGEDNSTKGLAILESEVYNSYYVKASALTLSEGKVASPAAISVLDFEYSQSNTGWTINYGGTEGGYLALVQSGTHTNLKPNQENAHYFTAVVNDGAWTLTSKTTSSPILYNLYSGTNPEFLGEGNYSSNNIYLFKQEVVSTEWITREVVTHTISYNANMTEAYTGTVPGNVSVAHGSNYTVSTATLSCVGYEFKGWNTDKTLTTGLTELSNVTADQELFGIWYKIPTYDIEFSVNGSKENTLKLDDQLEGTPIVFPDAAAITAASAFPETDKTFVGWTNEENKNYSHATVAPTLITSATATADVTYYAVFADVEESEIECAYDGDLSFPITNWEKTNNRGAKNTDDGAWQMYGYSSPTNPEGEINTSSSYSNLLSLDLNAKTGNNTTTLTVYYSSDKSTWTELTTKAISKNQTYDDYTISLSGIPATAQYLKIKNSTNSFYIKTITIASGNLSDYVTTIAPLDHIAITTAPTSAYKVGDALDLSGMVVTAYYGSTPKVITNYTASPANGTALTTENTKVTISFSTAEPVEQAIHVYELSGIVATNPTKMTYNAGDAFDPEGMVVTATWGGDASDAIHETVTPTSITPATLTNDTEADKVVTVTITYSHESVEKSTTVNVTVHPLPSVLMTWSVAGATDVIPQNNAYSNGADKYILKLPTTSPDPVAAGFTSDFVFMGWTKATSVNKDGTSIVYAAANDEQTQAETFYAVFAQKNGEDIPAGYKLKDEAPAADETILITRLVSGTYYAMTTDQTPSSSALTITNGVVSSSTSSLAWTVADATDGVSLRASSNYLHMNSSALKVASGTDNSDIVFTSNSDGSYKATRADGTRWIVTSGTNGFGCSATEENAAALYIFKYSAASYATYSNYRLMPSSVKAPTGLAAGTYYCESKTITLAQEDSKAIYYTTNGDVPTTASTLYENPFSINASCTIKAVAYDADEQDYSAVVEAEYVIVSSIDAPTMPASKTFYGTSESVEIEHALTTEGAVIRYSFDDVDYNDYSAALNITATTTVYAYATIGSLTSDKVSATYTKGEAVTYKKVTSAAELVPGMKFIIVSGTNAAKAGTPTSTGSRTYLNEITGLSITNGEVEIGEQTVAVFELGGKPGEYTMTAAEGQLGATAAKRMSYTEGMATWDITFDGENVTIASTTSSYGDLQYNSNGFTTYTSSQTAVEIYMQKPGYERTVREGYYGTICLPNGGKMIGTTLYEIAYYDAGEEKIFFDEVLDGNMVAGMPYIFQPVEGAQKLYQYTNASHVDSPVPAADANGLVGNLGSTITLSAGDYFLYNNQYYVVSASETRTISVPQYYAYIDMSEVSHQPTSPQPNRRRIAMSVHGEQVATGMDELNASEAPVKVMIDGKFYILRGEKMYDATGKLVK